MRDGRRSCRLPEGVHFHLLIVVFFGLASAPMRAGATSDVLYVRAGAAPGGNGLSWATALSNPEQARSIADPDGSGSTVFHQVWVTGGTYKPTIIIGGDPRNRSFILSKNLAYLGGFTGVETSASQRDPVANETILSGDINVPGVSTDNSYFVVRAGNIADATAVLDGFTIRDGHATGPEDRGAGVNSEGRPTLINCVIRDNVASFQGAGIYTTNPLTLIDCTIMNNTGPTSGAGGVHSTTNTPIVMSGCHFENNSGQTGGFFGRANATACVFLNNIGRAARGVGTFRECLFQGNTTSAFGGAVLVQDLNFPLQFSQCRFINNVSTGSRGGAIDIEQASAGTTIVNCEFVGNSCTTTGGAIFANFTTMRLTGCLFTGNSASTGGGASAPDSAVVRDCTFAGNSATSQAGGLLVGPSSTIANCIFWGNTVSGSSTEPAQLQVSSGSLSVSYSCIQGLTGALGGVGNIGVDPHFVNAAGPDLTPGTGDDDLHLQGGSPCIDSANNAAVPLDVLDIDGDLDIAEPTPIDLDGNARFFDDVRTTDTGSGSPPIVDRGAYEFNGAGPAPGPGTYVGPAGGSWFNPVNWFGHAVPGSQTDVVIPTTVVIDAAGAVAQSVDVMDGGALTVRGGTLVTDALLVRTGGLLTLSLQTSIVTVHDTFVIQAAATMQWTAGTIHLGNATWTSAIAINFGCAGQAVLALDNGGTVFAPSMTICALGTVQGIGAVHAAVTNSGSIKPGSPLGTIAIVGAYSQTSSGVLEMDINGYVPNRSHDVLAVTGAVTAGGTLRALVTPGFVPELAGVNTLLLASSVTGTFGVADLADLPGQFDFHLQTTSTTVSLLTTLSATGPRLFVKASAAIGGDGQSWLTAAKTLDGALAVASILPGQVSEVWVAAGTYVPSLRTTASDPRTSSFVLTAGLAVYGGFAGGESSLAQRNPIANVTILGGDVLGNDVPSVQPSNPTLNDNVYHVVTTSGLSSTTVLDGFTIRGGNANGSAPHDRGGGILNESGSPAILACTLAGNRAFLRGGAMYSINANLTLTNCLFDGNAAIGNQVPTESRGAALYNESSTLHLAACTFRNNSILSLGRGLAMYNQASSVIVSGGVFGPHQDGNAVRSVGGSTGTFTDCTFASNVGGDAPAFFGNGGATTFTNCHFLNNSTGFVGGNAGAVLLLDDNSAFDGCNFVGNHCSGNGGALVSNGSSGISLTLSNCQFSGNSAGTGGAIIASGSHPVTFTNCDFIDNTSTTLGGAMYNDNYANVVLDQCEFTGNSAQTGGAVYAFNSSITTLIDGMLHGNSATEGKGIYNRRATIRGTATLLNGDNLVNAGAVRPGFPAPGPVAGEIEIAGDYRHAVLGETGDVLPSLVMELGGPTPGSEHDLLNVHGTAHLEGGSLIAVFTGGFTPTLGDTFDIIVAPSVVGEFDTVGVVGLPGTLGGEISYTSTHVRLTIVEGTPGKLTGAPSAIVNGAATDAAVADYDGDGDPDLAVTVSTGISAQGNVVILRSAGVDVDGHWLGFLPLQVTIPIGQSNVTGIAAGDLNGDGRPDLAVISSFNGTLSIVMNLGGGVFDVTQEFPVGGPAGNVVIGQLVAGPPLDIAVPSGPGGAIRIFTNTGAGVFTVGPTIQAGTNPVRIAASDLDLDGDLDLAVANTSEFFDNPPPTLTIHVNGGGSFASPQFYGIGRRPVAMAVGLINADQRPDIVTANRLDGTISIMLASPAIPAVFAPALNIDIATEVFDMAALDLESDGDLDFVLIAKEPGEPPVLRAVHNVGKSGNGLLLSSEDLPTDQVPDHVFAGDIDGDGDDDLIYSGLIFGADGGVAGQGGSDTSISVLINEATIPIPADLNGDGVVNTLDLGILLISWGIPSSTPACGGSLPCPADINHDGFVNTLDLGILLASWTL